MSALVIAELRVGPRRHTYGLDGDSAGLLLLASAMINAALFPVAYGVIRRSLTPDQLASSSRTRIQPGSARRILVVLVSIILATVPLALLIALLSLFAAPIVSAL